MAYWCAHRIPTAADVSGTSNACTTPCFSSSSVGLRNVIVREARPPIAHTPFGTDYYSHSSRSDDRRSVRVDTVDERGSNRLGSLLLHRDRLGVLLDEVVILELLLGCDADLRNLEGRAPALGEEP